VNQYRIQSGQLADGKWVAGSYDEVVSAPNINTATKEADARIARGDGHAWETGDHVRVFGPDDETRHRPITDVNWT
jgi:hypothetical protein